jgi:prevent-host-death family protein
MLSLNLAQILQKKFIGTDELRKDLTEILDKLPSEGGEIVVTQHGSPQAVLIDMESYLELQETLGDLTNPGFVESIHQAASEVKSGDGITHEQLLKELKLKPA